MQRRRVWDFLAYDRIQDTAGSKQLHLKRPPLVRQATGWKTEEGAAVLAKERVSAVRRVVPKKGGL